MTNFAQIILTWYASHQRDLPWRNISDPYRIWVSEIILQQTRVVQGYDYYMRFISAFPNVDALAAAAEDEVLKLWQGLGYYSRARNMHAAAKQIVEQGGFPKDYEGVRSLKGVGDYTAAAICSFAYHLPCAVLDGNVFRVLSRYFGIKTPIDSTTGKKDFARLARELLPEKQTADYNQGIMDFGALQCVPKSPDCIVCPLVESCAAFADSTVDLLPVKQHKTKVTERFFVYLYVSTPEGIWLHRRKAGDIWQGLYECPLLEFDHKPTFDEVSRHPFVQSLAGVGAWKELKQGLKHVLTHRVIWADAYALNCDIIPALPEGFVSVPENELENYGMPQLMLRILGQDKI